MKSKIKMPNLTTSKAEQAFWDAIDLCDHFEKKDAQLVQFPNLKPSSKLISIRLPEPLLNRIKVQANEMDVPYQSLIKSSLHQLFFDTDK